MALHDSETVENVTPVLAAAKYFVRAPHSFGYEFGAATHIGWKRSENQDHYIVLRRARMQQLLLTNMPTEELAFATDETFAIAVADGMGGCGFGAQASQIAIRTGWDLAGQTSSWVMKLDDLDATELTERIEGFVYMLQQAFVEACQANPQLGPSGTTFTAAYFVSAFAAISQIGDSPCFLWRDGTMRRVSVDHTIEQEFISAGVAAEVAGKFSHMLTRCLGYQSHNARPDVHFLRLKPEDRLFVCTDGLTDLVSESEIASTVDELPVAQEACDRLIQLALDAGGKDNVTAVLARVK